MKKTLCRGKLLNFMLMSSAVVTSLYQSLDHLIKPFISKGEIIISNKSQIFCLKKGPKYILS